MGERTAGKGMKGANVREERREEGGDRQKREKRDAEEGITSLFLFGYVH